MNRDNNETYALITGASRGLGKAFALELAKKNTNLILVSLPGENLRELAEEIKTYGIDAISHETDLTNKENLLGLARWINENFELSVLINNAGIGGTGKFTEVEVEMLDQMIQLNIRATAILTHQLLPNLLRQAKAYVLNVSSLAALSPIAYKTIYPASKIFIHNFTRGLQQEFADSGVSFSVVNPGPMETNGDVAASIEKNGFWAKIIHLYPQQVATVTLRKMFEGDKVITLSWLHSLSLLLLKMPTGIKMPLLSRIFKKEKQL